MPDHKMPVLTSIRYLTRNQSQKYQYQDRVVYGFPDSGEDVQEALKLGVDGYLLKRIWSLS